MADRADGGLAVGEVALTAVRHTWVLLMALAVLLALDAGVRLGRDAGPAELAALAAFREDEPVSIRITWGEQHTRIHREDGGWMLPDLGHLADPELVGQLLGLLGRGVALDDRVDDGDHDRYGLTGADPVLVEVLGEGGPLVRLYVGHDAAGGASFVRQPDRPDVYRARIGGRARVARGPASWRDHRVLAVAPDAIVSIRAGGAHLARSLDLDAQGRVAPGPWRLEGTGLPVDQVLVDALAHMLGTMRAQELLSPDHPAGLDRPVAVLEVQADDGALHRLDLGRTATGAYAREVGARGSPVLRLPPQLVDLLATGPDAWRDRTLLVVDDIVSMTLIDEGGTAVAERDPRTGAWTLVRPARVDADPRVIAQAAATLSNLRADDLVEVDSEAAGFGRIRVLLVGADGAERTLEIGRLVPGRPQGQEQVYVRVGDRTGVWSARTWVGLRRAWLR